MSKICHNTGSDWSEMKQLGSTIYINDKNLLSYKYFFYSRFVSCLADRSQWIQFIRVCKINVLTYTGRTITGRTITMTNKYIQVLLYLKWS